MPAPPHVEYPLQPPAFAFIVSVEAIEDLTAIAILPPPPEPAWKFETPPTADIVPKPANVFADIHTEPPAPPPPPPQPLLHCPSTPDAPFDDTEELEARDKVPVTTTFMRPPPAPPFA